MEETREEYLIRFLRGCAYAADQGQLGVDMNRLLVNGDLMNEAADAFEAHLPDDLTLMEPTERLHFHLVRAEHHAQEALGLLYEENGPKRTIWFKMAIGRAQSILMSAYVRDVRGTRKGG